MYILLGFFALGNEYSLQWTKPFPGTTSARKLRDYATSRSLAGWNIQSPRDELCDCCSVGLHSAIVSFAPSNETGVFINLNIIPYLTNQKVNQYCHSTPEISILWQEWTIYTPEPWIFIRQTIVIFPMLLPQKNYFIRHSSRYMGIIRSYAVGSSLKLLFSCFGK